MDILMDRFDPRQRDKVDYIAFLREVAPSRRRSNKTSTSKAEKAADRLRMMIRQRAVAMKGNLRDPFRHFAQRRSKLDIRDFEEGMKKLEFRLSNRECEDVFNLIDLRRTGKIRFSDFAMFVSGSRYTDAEDKLRMLITRCTRLGRGCNLKKVPKTGYSMTGTSQLEISVMLCDAGYSLSNAVQDLVPLTQMEMTVSHRSF